MNLWHAECEILDHQISYMEALKIDGQSLIDEKLFKMILIQLKIFSMA